MGSKAFLTPTMVLLAICALLFVWEELDFPEDVNTGRKSLLGWDIPSDLMYDMPSNPYRYWRGAYFEALTWSRMGDQYHFYQGPMFEKVKQGQFWRLFTPCLLHGNLL